MSPEQIELARENLLEISKVYGSGNVEVDLLIGGMALAGLLVFLYILTAARGRQPVYSASHSVDPDRASIVFNDLKSEMQRMQTRFDHEIQSLRKELEELHSQLHYLRPAAETPNVRTRKEANRDRLDLGLVSQIREVFDRRSTIS